MTPKEKASEMVMLTPTQEAMQWVWEQRKSTNSKDAISALDTVYQHLQKVTLEKEKEVIENAVKQGWDYNEEGLVQWMGETYYNETFNTEECYHKGKYTYNKETFECHKCGLIVPNEYRFNTEEK